MRIRTITTAAAVAALSIGSFAGTAMADEAYVNDKQVPGHAKQERQGKVVTHYTQESDGCDYVVNTLGDFGGDPYLNDGQMMNRLVCDDGSVITYHIFHNTHPAFTGERETIWGSWEYFTTTNKAGR
jgi:hypothetical protein